MSVAGKIIRYGIDDQEEVNKLCTKLVDNFEEAAALLKDYKEMLDSMESKYIKETNDDVDIIIRNIENIIETVIEFNKDHDNVVESFFDLDNTRIN
ncbi:hypothetical protein R2F61_04035 [Mollicutes bacterium LVI A0078]|nr:hypothetical protein RZE84_04055 [Mollicutes bacterium LVI A0075]WOO91732.1 hypothetical protein R2F61_04035 [Mollicutes bacterium LVI A0078]